MRYVTKGEHLATFDDTLAPTERFAGANASFVLWLTTTTLDLEGITLLGQLTSTGCRVHETRADADRAVREHAARDLEATTDAAVHDEDHDA